MLLTGAVWVDKIGREEFRGKSTSLEVRPV